MSADSLYSADELFEQYRRLDDEINLLVRIGSIPQKVLPLSIVIVGGSALLAQNATTRQFTHDVDVLEADAELQAVLENYPMFNSRVMAYLDSLPYNYDERLRVVDIGLKHIKLITPSMEDLAVMKLYRWEDVDRQDMLNSRFLKKIDMQLLDHVVYAAGEAAASRIAAENNDAGLAAMRQNFEEFRKGVDAFAKEDDIRDFSA